MCPEHFGSEKNVSCKQIHNRARNRTGEKLAPVFVRANLYELRLCVWSPVHILVRIIIPFYRVDMSVEAASKTRSRTISHFYCVTFAYSDNQARHVACRQIHDPHVEQRCCGITAHSFGVCILCYGIWTIPGQSESGQ